HKALSHLSALFTTTPYTLPFTSFNACHPNAVPICSRLCPLCSLCLCGIISSTRTSGDCGACCSKSTLVLGLIFQTKLFSSVARA
ncbi:hypothetical protein DL96DRAFT_1812129, partial [Flagelloscypha sp. PMI_526]